MAVFESTGLNAAQKAQMRTATDSFADVLAQCAYVSAFAAMHDGANGRGCAVIMGHTQEQRMNHDMPRFALDFLAGACIFIKRLAVFFKG